MILMTYLIILRLSCLKLRSRTPRTSSLVITSCQPQGRKPVISTSRMTLALKEREPERIHQPAVALQRLTRYKPSGGQTGTQTKSNASIHHFINALGRQAPATARRDKRTRTAPFPTLMTSRSNHSLFYLVMNSRPCHQLLLVSSTATGRRILTIETSCRLLMLTHNI